MSFSKQDKLIAGDCYTSTEAMDNLTILCDDFGSRFGGTEGEKQAAEFMKAKLESYGCTNVQMEPFEYTGWVRGTTTLEIIEPIQKVIPCISLPHSPPASLTAELYDAHEGAPSVFENDDEDIRLDLTEPLVINISKEQVELRPYELKEMSKPKLTKEKGALFDFSNLVTSDIDKYMEEIMTYYAVPGASLGLIVDDLLVYHILK